LGVFEESSLGGTMEELRFQLESSFEDEDKILYVYSKELYNEVVGYINRYEVHINMKYKIVAKKIKLVTIPLLSDYKENVKRAKM